MKIEKEFYGEVDLDEEDSLELQTPIKVKYYKIKNIGLEEEGCSYGIEIIINKWLREIALIFVVFL